MRDLGVVIEFTMKEMVKRKSFIISTIIMMILIIIGFNVPNILKAIKGENTSDVISIIDENNVFEGNLNTLNNMNLGYEFRIENFNNETIDNAKKQISDDEIKACIIIENNNIKYLVKNTYMMESVPTECVNAINSIYSNLQITKLGLTEEQMQSLTPNFNFSLEQTEEQEVSGNIFTSMLISLVLFYAIYFCAYQVSSSITTEKTSKIMETLVTSTSPKTIVLGKTIGIGLVGLGQVIVLVSTAIICAMNFLEPELLNSIVDMSKMTPYLAIVSILYFIFGYFTFALLYALTGSTVSKPEDIQSANSPVAILAVIGFYLSYFTMMNPTSNLNVLASLLPISSPFCMPLRIMMGLASYTDVAISLGILVITILVISKIAIKIYSNAILNYGTKMTIKDMVKMYKDKNN